MASFGRSSNERGSLALGSWIVIVAFKGTGGRIPRERPRFFLGQFPSLVHPLVAGFFSFLEIRDGNRVGGLIGMVSIMSLQCSI